MVALFRILEGIALLTLGRKLFWLFVGAIGFEVGLLVALRVLQHQPEWFALIIALGIGILGAVLALFLQNVVIGIGGFFAGGIIAVGVLDALNFDSGVVLFAAFVIGGIIGVALVATLFDWALIGLSSLAGAIALANAFLPQRDMLMWLTLVVLFLIGLAIQGGWFKSEKKKTNG